MVLSAVSCHSLSDCTLLSTCQHRDVAQVPLYYIGYSNLPQVSCPKRPDALDLAKADTSHEPVLQTRLYTQHEPMLLRMQIKWTWHIDHAVK